MSASDSLYGVDTDYSAAATPAFAATSGRIGAAPVTGQAGRVVLFLDPTGKLRQAAVDAAGNLLTIQAGPTGGPLAVTGGAAAPALSAQQGPLMFGRQDSPSPASFIPVTLDGVGAVQTHLKSKPTHRGVLAQVVTGSSKAMVSVWNGSAGQIIRIQAISLYIAPQSIAAGGLLGSSAVIYVPVYCEMRRITGHTPRTGVNASVAIPTVSSDSADTLDSNVSLLSNATLTGLAAAAMHRGDANNMGTEWFSRGDPNLKTCVLRPGEGIAVICVSNGLVSSGGNTIQSVVDVEVTMTQSAG